MAGGIFGSLFGSAVAKGISGTPTYGMIPPLGSVPSATGLMISQATAMGVSAVNACVARVSKDVARCRPKLVRVDTGEGLGSQEVFDHPVAKLFQKPNRVQTWYEFARQQQTAKMLRGNAYAAKLGDSRGNVLEMIPINPDAVMVMEGVDGEIFYNTNRLGLFQIAVLSKFPTSLHSEDMIHWRDVTFNMLVAPSTIGMARDAIGLTMGLEQQAARFIKNGARPSGVLQMASGKTASSDVMTRLRAQFDNFMSGLQGAGQTLMLEDGITWNQVHCDNVSSEFTKQREGQLLECARFFNIPPYKLGIPVAAPSTNIQQLDQSYINDTVAPEAVCWEEKLTDALGLREQGLMVKLDLDGLLRADPLTRYNLGRIGKLSGLTKTNEFRRGEGLPDVPGGDEVMQPVNMAVLGSNMSGTAPDGAGHPTDNTVPDEGVPTKPNKDDSPE